MKIPVDGVCQGRLMLTDAGVPRAEFWETVMMMIDNVDSTWTLSWVLDFLLYMYYII